MPVTLFPPGEIAVRLLVASGCGLLVGLERQWSHKELGVRTFTIVSLLGALAALISTAFEVGALAGVIVLTVLATPEILKARSAAETTTAAALMATLALGVLAGEGHVFTPAAAVILITLLLSLKPQLARFAVGLSVEEVRSAVLLALIAFVIYPVLPNRFVDPWRLLNPREAWLIVILISSLGFLNYILLRLFSARGLYYSAVFGGLVNSTAAIGELSGLVRDTGDDAASLAAAVNLLTVAAMFVRNLALVAILSPAAGLRAAPPILAMAAASVLLVFRGWRRNIQVPSLHLGSPLEMKKVASFAVLFLAIQVASVIGQRLLGTSGLAAVSALGGLASSASSTAAAASLAARHEIGPNEAAICAVAASMASMAVNPPVLYRQFRDLKLMRHLLIVSGAVCGIGLAALVSEVLLTTK